MFAGFFHPLRGPSRLLYAGECAAQVPWFFFIPVGDTLEPICSVYVDFPPFENVRFRCSKVQYSSKKKLILRCSQQPRGTSSRQNRMLSVFALVYDTISTSIKRSRVDPGNWERMRRCQTGVTFRRYGIVQATAFRRCTSHAAGILKMSEFEKI